MFEVKPVPVAVASSGPRAEVSFKYFLHCLRFLWYPHWPLFLWYLYFLPSSSFLCKFDFFILSNFFYSLILFNFFDVFFSTMVNINKQSRGSRVKRPLRMMSRRRRRRESWRRRQEKKTSPKTHTKTTTTTTTTTMWRKRLTENLPREKCPSLSIYKEPEM